jgi:hypothetical protein
MDVAHLCREGNEHYVNAKYSDAIKKYNQALKHDPNNGIILWYV